MGFKVGENVRFKDTSSYHNCNPKHTKDKLKVKSFKGHGMIKLKQKTWNGKRHILKEPKVHTRYLVPNEEMKKRDGIYGGLFGQTGLKEIYAMSENKESITFVAEGRKARLKKDHRP